MFRGSPTTHFSDTSRPNSLGELAAEKYVILIFILSSTQHNTNSVFGSLSHHSPSTYVDTIKPQAPGISILKALGPYSLSTIIWTQKWVYFQSTPNEHMVVCCMNLPIVCLCSSVESLTLLCIRHKSSIFFNLRPPSGKGLTHWSIHTLGPIPNPTNICK